MDCKKEHLVSISFGKLVPVEVAKSWLGSNPSHSQLVIKAADDLQTVEQVPATQKTHTRFHSSSHSGNLSPSGVGWGRSSYNLYLRFSFFSKGREWLGMCHL